MKAIWRSLHRTRILALLSSSTALLLWPSSLQATQAAIRAEPPSGNSAEEAKAILKAIDLNACDIDIPKDLANASQALRVFENLHDPAGEAEALLIVGDINYSSGHFNKALPYLNRALASMKQQSNLRGEARAQLLLAYAFQQLGQPESSKTAGGQAFRLYTQLADDPGAAASLHALGELDEYQDPGKAVETFQRALKLSIASGDMRTQAAILTDQGDMAIEANQGDAFALYQRALDIENKSGDCRNKAATLSDIASHDEEVGRPQAALDLYTQALAIEHRLGDLNAEAEIRNAQAKAYEDLADFHSALHSFQQSLQTERSLGALQDEATTIRSIGDAYLGQSKFTQALRRYRQALPMLRQTHNAAAETVVINNLGWIYANLGSPKTARAYYNRASAMAESDDPIAVGYAAWGIGQLEQADALESYFKAQRLFQSTQQTEFEGLVDAALMKHFKSRHQTSAAIFFGKRAIDCFQAIRRNMSGLSQALQLSFLEAKADPYRTLAQLLIDEGRLYEAQQILDLMKLQEFTDYTRTLRSDATANPTRTTTESQFEAQYQKDTENIVALEKNLQALKLKLPDSKQEYEQTKAQLDKDTKAFLGYGHRLALQPKTSGVLSTNELEAKASNLQRAVNKRPETIGVYTLMGNDKLRLIVVTSTSKVWRSYPISKKLLEEKCAAFLDLLRTPKADPSPAAAVLFKILFGPVQKDIEQSGAQTVVWYLDGALRYLPLSTLRNPVSGKYLIEDYNLASYSPFIEDLTTAPKLIGATGIAMGTTRSYDEKLGALPNVTNELSQIVTDPTYPKSQGMLRGTILLDSAFTLTAMEQKITTQSIVHIASHFLLVPGNAEQSFLLLGGKDTDGTGYHFSVLDFLGDRDLQLEGKELVTLSACKTGAGSKGSDGVEVDSVSDVVFQKGAKAAISSLWEVNDQSTGALMADFYKQWIGSNGAMTKAEALRKAQLDLLQGKILPQADFTNPNAPTTFSHPYYWAPFVLMGNWQ